MFMNRVLTTKSKNVDGLCQLRMEENVGFLCRAVGNDFPQVNVHVISMQVQMKSQFSVHTKDSSPKSSGLKSKIASQVFVHTNEKCYNGACAFYTGRLQH